MQLRTTNRHLKGKAIHVNGHTYPIDADGVTTGDVRDTDAVALLLGPGWSEVHSGVVAETPKRGRPKKEPMLMLPIMGTAQATVSEEVDEKDVAKGIAEWPDPDASMSKQYLHAMAKAYSVKFSNATSSATLVNRIREVMYRAPEA